MDGTVEGTNGSDIIDVSYTGDPEGDRIDANDALLPGASGNDDLVVAGPGNDTVLAGDGDDVVFGGADDDRLYGGAGDDTLNGDAGQDILWGDAGDDVLNGGAGDDTLKGGTGEDIISGGEGADVVGGGDDADTIVAGAGDQIDGGAGGNDADTLDLSEVGPYTLINVTPDSNGNGFDGTVVLLDADGNPTGEIIEFTEIEFIVDDANRDPIAVDDMAEVVEDGSVTIPVLANDSDPDGDPLTITSASAPNGDVVINPDGTLTYTPNPDYSGPDEITYVIDDGNGGTDTGTVVVDVTPVNEPPVANDDGPRDVPEDGSITLPVLFNDSDPDGDDLTIIEATAPNGTVVINPNGTLTYTPDPDYNGPDQITYTITDGNGGTDSAVVDLNVTPVNDAPDAVDDSDTTDEDTPITVDLLANDSDVDGDMLTVVSAELPPEQGTITDNGDGTVTYTPAPDFTGTATITYTIEDEEGLQDTAVHTIEVTPVGDAPVAGDDSAETPEDTSVTIPVLDNDSDPDGDPLTITDATSPNGDVTINPDGTLTFTPDPDFNGPTEITYTITDPDGNEATGTVTVDVTPVNDAPDAVDDSDTTPFNTPITVDLLANDSDVDGDALTVISATVPAEEGTLVDNGDGTVTFTPADGFTGTATISYTIEDEEGLTDSAVHTVDVAAPVLDGTVEGTTGDDLIDAGYMGDPEGDMVDNNDAILPGDTGNDDLILAFDGDDTVLAGDGDDEIYGQDGDDSILGGDGNDLVYGGNGDDVIDTTDGAPTGPGDFDNPYPPLPEDPIQDDDLDTVYGGAGNDIISTGDDRDTIFGGDGNDTIDAGIDDDEVTAGRGDDTVVGSEGNDLIYGGDGDDVIYGGLDPSFPDELNIPDDEGDLVPDNGQDTIYGGAGNDTIFGEDDDDTIFGGQGDDVIDGGVDDDSLNGQSGDDIITGGQGNDTIAGGDGNDTLDGGEDDDTIYGNAGNDVITGGEGADELFGGDDRDTFIGGDAGEVVDGGSGGDDFDTLDLTGSGVDFITYTSPDREDGIVTFLDGTTMTFTEIENVIPCFTPGTTIATPRGERLVEELREGDRIITRDNGIQEIRWVGRKDLTGKNLVGSPHLRPVLIKAGSLGNGLPERDMLVSPNHRLLVANDRTQLYFEESEVLAAAKHLVGGKGVHQVDVMQVSYIHFMFDRHEVVLSNGAWTESFQPGDYSMKGLGNSQRNEIFELFPELATKQGLEGYQAARKSLKKHEAKLLVK